MHGKEDQCHRDMSSLHHRDTDQVDHHRPPEIKKEFNDLKEWEKEYSSQFTIHGLSRLWTGRTKAEKLFWTVILIVLIGYLAFIMSAEIKDYLQYNVWVAKKKRQVNALPYPAVTLCFSSIVKKAMNCFDCECDVIDHGNCHNTTRNQTETNAPFFNKGNIRAKGRKAVTILRENLTIHASTSGRCVTFNQDGAFKQVSPHKQGRVWMEFEDKVPDRKNKWLRIFVHNSSTDSSANDVHYFYAMIGESVFIELQRIDLVRMAPPYQSMCGVGDTFFPGTYTAEGCMATCEIKTMLDKCNGHVIQK